MNYSKHVKSINGATKPDIEYREVSQLNAQASKFDCPIDVRVSLPAASCVETHEHQGSEDRPSLSSVILMSKVVSLKSLHDVNIDLPTELDPPLRTSIHVLVQNSAPQAPESTLAGHVMQASIHQKIVSKNVLLSEIPLLDIYPNPKGPSGLVVPSTHPKGQLM